MSWTQSNIDATREQIYRRSATDKDFRARVLADPVSVIKEVSGLELPSDYRIKVIENAEGVDETFVLPDMNDAELSDQDLDDVSGGGCKNYTEVHCKGANSFTKG